MIKKILIAVAVLVVLVIAAAVILPFVIPTDTIKQELQAQVKKATGRDLTINGNFEFSLLPDAVLKANDVRFQNAAGGSRADMVTLKELRVHVALLPLLSSEVEVQEFVLEDPDILLEIDQNGQPNWAFGGGGAQAGGSAAGSPASTGGGRGGELKSVKLGDVRIVNGRLEYRDAQSGSAEVVENLNVKINLPSLDEPFSADGEATWKSEAIAFNIGAESPRALMTGGKTGVTVSLNGNPLKLDYAGALDAGAGSIAGKLDLDVPSLRNLAAWAASPLDIKGDEALNAMTITGQVAASAAQVSITGMALSLDAINATGELAVALGGKVPSAKGKLDVADLDMNPYLAAFGGEAGDQSGEAAAKPASSTGGGWSDEPIDMSALRSVDADLVLSAGSLKAQDIKIGKSQVHVQLKGGKLNLNLSEMALYNGNGSLQLNVDASGDIPAIKSTFALAGLQAEPFLTDAAKLEWLSGTAQMSMDVTTKGASQKALVNALNGRGDVKFTDGAIRGINLAAMVRNASNAFLNRTASEAVKTDFAELSGTYTITNGVVSNNDLQLLSPLLRVTGEGTANMPAQTVNYRVEPKAVASLEGQGGDSGMAGLMVPVIIEGPWSKPSYRPDLAGAIGGIAKDPSKMLEGAGGAADQLKDAVKDPGSALKSLMPGSGATDGASGSDGETTAPSPMDNIKKLFGQ
jgi:AsmA protein